MDNRGWLEFLERERQIKRFHEPGHKQERSGKIGLLVFGLTLLGLIVGSSTNSKIQSAKAQACRQIRVLKWSHAVRLNPDDAKAHFNLGEAHLESYKPEAGIRAYKEATRLDPQYVDAYQRLAECYWKVDQPKKAIEMLERVEEVAPNHKGACMQLVFAYINLERFEEAVSRINQFDDDEAAALWCYLGYAYRAKGHIDKAIPAYTCSLSLNPNRAQTHLGLGQLYVEMGDKQNALQEYERLKELDQKLAGQLYSMLQEHGSVTDS